MDIAWHYSNLLLYAAIHHKFAWFQLMLAEKIRAMFPHCSIFLIDVTRFPISRKQKWKIGILHFFTYIIYITIQLNVRSFQSSLYSQKPKSNTRVRQLDKSRQILLAVVAVVVAATVVAVAVAVILLLPSRQQILQLHNHHQQ